MATIDELGEALKTRLETISGLRVSWLPPEQINVPQAVILPGSGTYHVRPGDGQGVTFHIVIYAASAQQGNQRGADKVLPYIDKSGASSIKAALEAEKTLGGKASELYVRPWHDFDALKDYNGQEYWGAIVDVEVRD